MKKTTKVIYYHLKHPLLNTVEYNKVMIISKINTTIQKIYHGNSITQKKKDKALIVLKYLC